MAERLRSADSQTVEAAVERMARGVDNLGELVGQLETAIAVCNRAGGVLSVDVYEAVQNLGRKRLGEIQDALDCLTVGGRRPKNMGALAETARGGTDIDI